MDEQPRDYEDLTSLDERHLRAYFSEVIQIYRQEMKMARNGPEQVMAAQLLERALLNFATFMWRDQKKEIEQLIKEIARWRGVMPRPFED